MARMRWRHHDLIKPIELNFERKITKARISTNIFPSQFLAQQHAKKLQLEGDEHNKWEVRTCAPCPRGDVNLACHTERVFEWRLSAVHVHGDPTARPRPSPAHGILLHSEASHSACTLSF